MGEKFVPGTPLILIVENEQPLSNIHDLSRDTGANVKLIASGDEATALLSAGGYKALVTDVRLAGSIDGWGSGKTGQDDRSGLSDYLHDRSGWGGMARAGRSQ
jgi:hypothetical protein